MNQQHRVTIHRCTGCKQVTRIECTCGYHDVRRCAGTCHGRELELAPHLLLHRIRVTRQRDLVKGVESLKKPGRP